jgi:hypothetical protein
MSGIIDDKQMKIDGSIRDPLTKERVETSPEHYRTIFGADANDNAIHACI